MNENIKLPSSDYDEPGMYWFLAEITLRRIFSRPRQGMGWSQLYTSLYEPMVAEEISQQLVAWHDRLPDPLRFSLDESGPVTPVTDPQKGFLRAQYYALQATVFWPYAAKMLTLPSQPSVAGDSGARAPDYLPESGIVQRLATKALRFLVVHIFAVESLLRYRHLMLLADQTGVYAVTMMMLCAYDAHPLRGIQHPQMRDAIIAGWRCLKLWERNPGLRMRVEKIERLMRVKGIGDH